MNNSAQAIKLQIGKIYLMQCGEKIKITKEATGYDLKSYGCPLVGKSVSKYPVTVFFNYDGSQSERQPAAYRIISEVQKKKRNVRR